MSSGIKEFDDERTVHAKPGGLVREEHPFFVFLDRDGTVIQEKNYLSRVEDITFIAGSEEAIARLNKAGVKVVMISNQSGVARGYFPERTVHDIHRAIQEHLAAYNAHLDAFYYCPHHPDEECSCRKPKTAMLERAAQDLGLSLCGVMVGDQWVDLATARAAGITAILVRTGYGEKLIAEGKANADFVASNLAEAAEWILSHHGHRRPDDSSETNHYPRL